MKSKFIFLIFFCLIGILYAKERVLPEGDDTSPKGKKDNKKELGDSNRPSYTDDEIIALIKKELNERERNHNAEFATTMDTNAEFTTTRDSDVELTTTVDTESVYDVIYSTEDKTKDNNKYGIDEVISTAWEIFGDDIPSILKTMSKLNEAKNDLNDNYDQYENYGEYIESIKNNIDELLGDYNIVYAQTNDLIELIGNIYVYTLIHKNDNLRRLLQSNDLDNIEKKAWETFGDDFAAIEKTVLQIKESMNDIQYWNIDEEYKLSLKNKMLQVLKTYDAIIENTNQLIEKIKEFYFMTNDNN